MQNSIKIYNECINCNNFLKCFLEKLTSYSKFKSLFSFLMLFGNFLTRKI